MEASPSPVRCAVVVAGVAESARHRLAHDAADLGLVEQDSHRVDGDRLVVSFDWEPERAPSHADGGAIAQAAIVRELRRRGIAAVAGPRSDGHAVAWAARNAPVPFGSEACVCFPWTVAGRDRFETIVEIDPGAGFGAGGHPTTHLLLERLAAMDLAGKRVLDVGCGTGVLSIAAAMLGAASVTAIDIDPAAVEATARNIAANHVDGQVDVVLGELEDGFGSGFEVVVANIVLEVLVSIGPRLETCTAPGGVLAVSGLSPAQPSTLAAMLTSMVPIWTDEGSEWVAVGFESA